MFNTLPRCCPWAVVGLGGLLLLLPLWAQNQLPEPASQPAGRQQDPDSARPADSELQSKRAALLSLEVRLRADLEVKRNEIRLAEERLSQVREQLDRLAQRVAPSLPGANAPPKDRAPRSSAEQRFQLLEQEIVALQREVAVLRRDSSGQKSADKRFTLDLQTKTNHKSKDTFHSGRYPGNNLASLAAGEQTLEGIKFQIGDGVMQLGSNYITDKPDKISAIPVGRKSAKLHILHATGYSVEEQDVRIGAYTVHYQDGSTETIPIVYGKDVLDWWKYPGNPEPTRGKVVWEGANEPAKEFDATIRLYLTTWENPHPDKSVRCIDYSSTMETICAPFCVAISAEAP